MKRFRNRYLLAVDAVLLAVLPFLVYALRFESFRWQPQDTRTAIVFGVVMLPLEIGILLGFGLYRRLWRFASIWELKLIFAAGVAASLVAWAVGGSVRSTLSRDPAARRPRPPARAALRRRLPPPGATTDAVLKRRNACPPDSFDSSVL